MSDRGKRAWPTYATIWRWHFYAGLFCIPFVLWLAATGSLYLWRPQVEAWLDKPYAHVLLPGLPRATDAAMADAAARAVPGSVLHRFQLPDTPDQAVQVLVGRGREETRVYVHPQTLAILKAVDEDSRPMRLVFRLHGEMLAGNWGSYLVELAASWAIVMILSGLFLWWPRGQGLAGTLFPRLRLRGRAWWRDLHGVIGFLVSLFALGFLVSGLPWAKSWGSYLRAARGVGAVVSQDWTTSYGEELNRRALHDAGTREMMGEHAEHQGMAMRHPRIDYRPLDRVAGAVVPLGLASPVLIAPPAGRDQPWTVKSDAADRPLRVDLTVDPSGQILTRVDFADRALLDRLVGTGVAAHEGQWFGLANQLLNQALAIGLALLALSGAMMWWKRRPDGVLGAPPMGSEHRLAAGFFALLAALGIFLPMLGVSALIVVAAERLLLRRLRKARAWLGLAPV